MYVFHAAKKEITSVSVWDIIFYIVTIYVHKYDDGTIIFNIFLKYRKLKSKTIKIEIHNFLTQIIFQIPHIMSMLPCRTNGHGSVWYQGRFEKLIWAPRSTQPTMSTRKRTQERKGSKLNIDHITHKVLIGIHTNEC